MLPTLFVFIGDSSTGKTTYIKDRVIKDDVVHWICCDTTRDLRSGEKLGEPYYVRDASYFHNDKEDDRFVVHIFANKDTYKLEGKEWHYAVTKAEIDKHAKQDINMVYDVIQPCYAKDMIDYFKANYPHYNIKVAWFIAPEKGPDVISARANMPNDSATRAKNRCTPLDVVRAKLHVDYMLCPLEDIGNPALERYLMQVYNSVIEDRERQKNDMLNHHRKR